MGCVVEVAVSAMLLLAGDGGDEDMNVGGTGDGGVPALVVVCLGGRPCAQASSGSSGAAAEQL